MYYAQLDQNSICIAVTQSSGPLVGPQFISLDNLDTSVLLKKWQGGSWVVVQ